MSAAEEILELLENAGVLCPERKSPESWASAGTPFGRR